MDASGKISVVTLNKPDLVKRLVKLHKGHGPGLFKTPQKIMAVGLVIILLSDFWLGIYSQALRAPTLITSIAEPATMARSPQTASYGHDSCPTSPIRNAATSLMPQISRLQASRYSAIKRQ